MNTKSYTNELLSSESRYKLNLNVVEYNGHQMYDIPYLVSSDPKSDDEYLSVVSSYKDRLDKVAYEYYVNSKYWWVLGHINNILNPFDVPVDTLMRITAISNLLLEGVLT